MIEVIVIIPILKEGSTFFYLFYMFRKGCNVLKRLTQFKYKLKLLNNSIKIKSNVDSMMLKLHERALKIWYARELRILEQRQKKDDRIKQKYKELKKKEKYFNELNNEKVMEQKGFYKCKCCMHYVCCDTLLEDVHASLQKSKPLNNQQSELILNNNKSKKNKISNFEEIEEHLKTIIVNCRKCKQSLNFNTLRNLSEDGELFSTECILHLQDKKRRLIYHNIPVIEFENLIAK
jgi:hypothetical protein